jgi:hypothetical protein
VADPAKAGSSHGWRGRPPSVARPAPRGGAAGPKGWRDLWSAPRGGVAGSDRRLPSALGSLSPLSDLSLDSSLSLWHLPPSLIGGSGGAGGGRSSWLPTGVFFIFSVMFVVRQFR